MNKKALIYLDYAAATPLDPKVLVSMTPYLTTNFYNPSASYSAAKEVSQAIEMARAQVAYYLGAKQSEIIFTAGATEANNLAIHGLMKQYPEGNMVFSAIEHESVIEPAKNYDFRQVKVANDGRLDLKDLRQKIDQKTVLVSVMQANNEIGTIQPIREISRIVNEVRLKRGQLTYPIYLHTDAAQAANYLDLHVARLGVDLMSLNGGKIYGPKQSGALYIRSSVKLKPLVEGGGQERGLRSGTENVAAIVGFGRALEIAQISRHTETKRLTVLQKLLFDLIKNSIKTVNINGSLKSRLPNNVHITIPGVDNERLLFELDQAGVAASAGSACSASNEQPSHVLTAIGKTDEEARSSIRITLGRFTNQTQINKAADSLVSLINADIMI